jgi:Rieske Fe-S protein
MLSRRSALRGLAVAVVGGIAGFVVARTSGAAESTTAANGYGSTKTGSGKLLAPLDRVPESGGLILADDKIVLTGAPGGTVHAFSAVCTHQGCTVSSVDNGAIICPCHGSRFDAQTGSVVAGPAQSPLRSIPVVIHDNGVYTA